MDQAVKKTVLKNGIKILTKKIPQVHSVSMGVWVNVGARDEDKKENGLSHFIEHMLFKGTVKRTAYQLAKEFDAIGGQFNAFTSMEVTCFHARVMDNHLETMTEMLSDIFLNSSFDPNEVENERPVILSEIGMVEDNPEEYVHTLLEKNMWGDHPLGRSILGTKENVDGFSAEMIKKFFYKFYQQDKIIISAAGNIDHEKFVDLVGPSFETVCSNEKLPKRKPPSDKFKISLSERKLEQVHVCIGTKGKSITDPARFSTSLMNTILGGNMSSRLFQEIREKHGLAYSVYSFTSAGEDSGLFGIYVGTAPDTVEKAIELIFKEIRILKSKKVPDSELKDAKEYTKGNIMLSSESTDNQMVRLAQSEIHFGRYIPLTDIIKKIDAVTSNEIYTLTHELFDSGIKPGAALLGTLPPKNTIEKLIYF